LALVFDQKNQGKSQTPNNFYFILFYLKNSRSSVQASGPGGSSRRPNALGLI